MTKFRVMEIKLVRVGVASRIIHRDFLIPTNFSLTELQLYQLLLIVVVTNAP
jgi:hypothetical protein